MAVLVLPQLSVTDQVRTIVPQPSTTVLLVSVATTLRLASQLSVAVTVAMAGIASHDTVASAGTPTKVGAFLSSTVSVWLAVLVLPQLSVTDQVRTIVPQP